MTLELKPMCAPCYNFVTETGMKKVTCIIAPIRISQDEDKSMTIAWACNHGSTCQNHRCRYSSAWDKQKSINRNQTNRFLDEL